MPIRRCSPAWVREMNSQSLHRLGGKLLNDYRYGDLTERQDALWQAVVSELAYRQRRRVALDRCTCLLCCDPFEEGPEAPAERRRALLDS